MPKRRSRRSAVSGVTPRFPCNSSLTRGYETPSRSAKPVWLRPSGLRTLRAASHQDASVVHASEFAPSVLPSVIIRDLDPLRSLLGPNETDPVLVVDPDAVLPLPVFAQRF